MRIAIFAAMRWECRSIVRNLRKVSRHKIGAFPFWEGTTSAASVTVVQTGIGTRRSGSAGTLIGESARYDLFVSTGCAGALDDELVTGDIVVASGICTPSGETLPTDLRMSTPFRFAAKRAQLRYKLAPLLCSDEALLSTEAKRAAARADRAALLEIPFVAVRTILDDVTTELDEPAMLVNPTTGRVRPLAVARLLARGRSSWKDLSAMRQMAATAEANLHKLFAEFLARPSD
jgi:hypothetical protein